MAIQKYPRDDEDFLDESKLVRHQNTLNDDEFATIVHEAITYAQAKSKREILDIPEGIDEAAVEKIYRKSGKGLFRYFVRYCGDPAGTAHQCNGRHYSDVAREQFRNRTLQKERMNSGWRYQHIALHAAEKMKRFSKVSDIGAQEADFNATVAYQSGSGALTIYVSVKNRTNTMGGQDWPKAIAALEQVAVHDKNRHGDYICVFGIAMEHGGRLMKLNGKTRKPHSENTEVWKSDFFWPFFANCGYKELIAHVLKVMIESTKPEVLDAPVPDALIDEFGAECKARGLLDDQGKFNDPYALVELFCGGSK